jgi:hypothetical protein
MNKAIEMVIAERKRQDEKWGDQSGNHPFEWMSILGEEFGELCEAVNETHFQNGAHKERGGKVKIIKEAIQVAAVAVALVEGLLKSREGAAIKPSDLAGAKPIIDNMPGFKREAYFPQEGAEHEER